MSDKVYTFTTAWQKLCGTHIVCRAESLNFIQSSSISLGETNSVPRKLLQNFTQLYIAEEVGHDHAPFIERETIINDKNMYKQKAGEPSVSMLSHTLQGLFQN